MPKPLDRSRDASRDVAFRQPWIRIAAEFVWANPHATWQHVADHSGRSRRQLERIRRTEEWEVAVREAGAAYVVHLAPHAAAGLLKAWAKGNPAGALEVLTRLGFLRPTELRIDQAAPMEAARKTFDKLLELKRLGLLTGDDVEEAGV